MPLFGYFRKRKTASRDLCYDEPMQLVLTNELLLEAYRQGLFPMAYSAGSPYIHWVCPEMRGQLSITDMHIPRSLKKDVRQALRSPDVKILINTDFEGVIKGCAGEDINRPETWINDQIRKAFIALHKKGHAHSVEYWENGLLKGGLYGLALGGAFFGESMFSRTDNASKICLVHLAARLWRGGFTLLDTQFINDHLKQFGVYEVPHAEYVEELQETAQRKADFLLSGIREDKLIEDYFEMRSTKPAPHHPNQIEQSGP